jgi:transcriptional regulator with XRE-family HTH domain
MSSVMTGDIGQLLRQLRRKRRLTLEQAAQAAGLSRSAVNRWETGVNQPRLAELNALLEALGASPQQRRAAIAQMDAPRAQAQVQAEVTHIAEQVGIGPKPNGGDLLRALRMRRSLSLEVVAERLGVTVRTLRRWENTEVWPSTEQLHQLCYVLKAQEEEVIALTCGRFALRSSEKRVSLEALETELRELLRNFHNISNLAAIYALADMTYLALEARIWPLAARDPAARNLLASFYARHADHLAGMNRFVEAARYVERAFEMLPKRQPSEPFWLYAGIASARTLVYRGTQPAPARGIRQLRYWLPLAQEPAFQAWILADIAKYEALQGEMTQALQLAEQACRVVVRCENTTEWTLRQQDQAQVALAASRPEEALSLLTKQEALAPRQRAKARLLQAEAHLARNATTEAYACLQKAQGDIATCDLTYLWLEAEALEARF